MVLMSTHKHDWVLADYDEQERFDGIGNLLDKPIPATSTWVCECSAIKDVRHPIKTTVLIRETPDDDWYRHHIQTDGRLTEAAPHKEKE